MNEITVRTAETEIQIRCKSEWIKGTAIRSRTVLRTEAKDKRRPDRRRTDGTGEMEGGDGSRLVSAYRTLWERDLNYPNLTRTRVHIKRTHLLMLRHLINS
ncbi:hypothetical protein PUN28_016414 [Cardiocondyla obscurior]|uniref:Uncharacterized protein n=1 Tax=Cardiocondyla obscurior TaxID=286306 RepID=A0AAW2EN83_9HYME